MCFKSPPCTQGGGWGWVRFRKGIAGGGRPTPCPSLYSGRGEEGETRRGQGWVRFRRRAAGGGQPTPCPLPVFREGSDGSAVVSDGGALDHHGELDAGFD